MNGPGPLAEQRLGSLGRPPIWVDIRVPEPGKHTNYFTSCDPHRDIWFHGGLCGGFMVVSWLFYAGFMVVLW